MKALLFLAVLAAWGASYGTLADSLAVDTPQTNVNRLNEVYTAFDAGSIT